MNRELYSEPDAVCDSCGAKGATDFMGDCLCDNCLGAQEIGWVGTDLRQPLTELETQILQAVANYKYREIALCYIPIGVDAKYSITSIFAATRSLTEREYLQQRAIVYFSLTDKGRAALPGESECFI